MPSELSAHFLEFLALSTMRRMSELHYHTAPVGLGLTGPQSTPAPLFREPHSNLGATRHSHSYQSNTEANVPTVTVSDRLVPDPASPFKPNHLKIRESSTYHWARVPHAFLSGPSKALPEHLCDSRCRWGRRRGQVIHNMDEQGKEKETLDSMTQ